MTHETTDPTAGEGCRRFPTGWLCEVDCSDPVHDEFAAPDTAGESA